MRFCPPRLEFFRSLFNPLKEIEFTWPLGQGLRSFSLKRNTNGVFSPQCLLAGEGYSSNPF